MATPHVAGVAALLSSMDPTLNVMQLKALITGNVDVLAVVGQQRDDGRAAQRVQGGERRQPAADRKRNLCIHRYDDAGQLAGMYGGDGESIVGDVTSLPAYASLTSTGLTYTWDSAPSDPRALKRVGTGRVAATWYSDPSFDLDVNVTSGTHKVALYCLDWDTTSRSQRVDVLNAATSARARHAHGLGFQRRESTCRGTSRGT